MDFPTFNLGRFYSLRNKDGDNLNLSAFNGESSITVWKKGDQGKPSLKVKIGTYAAVKMIKKLKELLQVSTEARMPLVFSNWNKDSKSYEVDYTICLVKDDKARYYIEISGHGTSAKFAISASQPISEGDNTVTSEMRSHEGVIELITILDKYIPIADIVSSYRPPRADNPGQPRGKDPFNKPKSPGIVPAGEDDLPF